MFFVLSKVLLFLIAPLSWIFIVFVWMWLSKSRQRKRNLLLTAMLLVFLFTNPFIYKKAVLAWQPEPVKISSEKKFSAGILLGGMMSFDKNHNGFFGANADRFIATEKLYHQGIIYKIIVSGGSGDLLHQEDKEADFLKNELIASGVNNQDIIIENKSRNTFENAINSKKIADSLQLKQPYILITSAIHMPRALKVCRKAGLVVMPFPCDFHEIHSRLSWTDYIIPDPSLLNEWKNFIKEIVGVLAYQITGKA